MKEKTTSQLENELEVIFLREQSKWIHDDVASTISGDNFWAPYKTIKNLTVTKMIP